MPKPILKTLKHNNSTAIIIKLSAHNTEKTQHVFQRGALSFMDNCDMSQKSELTEDQLENHLLSENYTYEDDSSPTLEETIYDIAGTLNNLTVEYSTEISVDCFTATHSTSASHTLIDTPEQVRVDPNPIHYSTPVGNQQAAVQT
ncbi:hypothetical protein Bhyg_03544, partial [Pseudolycoriella hygida]